MPHPGPGSIAVIGAGVAGCGLVAALRQQGLSARLSLWELGRGTGGRAGSRRSRRDAGLLIDHGAPLLNITAEPPPQLLAPLLAGGWLEPCLARVAALQGESRLVSGCSDGLLAGRLYRGRGGMEQLCRGLLELAGPAVQTHFGTVVRHLAVTPAGCWQLRNAEGALLEEADWLVLSSTLLAHPRSQALLGWPAVPLRQVAAGLGDLQLDHALTTIAGLRFQARLNLLLVLPAELAGAWRQLPFDLLHFDAAAQQRWGLQRLVIQPLADGRCALVAHSSPTFAADHLHLYGERSAVAQLLGEPPNQERQAAVMATLENQLLQALKPWLGCTELPQQSVDRQLMRWGAAFPVAPGLPSELALCRRSRVGFCGDYLAGPGFGRVEGALRSAEGLARALAA
jgi:predicted NAD/FAD-dependent oxidoreductase